MSDEVSNPLAPGDHYANPLPPPSKPKGSGGPPPATPMSNSDFRKVRATAEHLVPSSPSLQYPFA